MFVSGNWLLDYKEPELEEPINIIIPDYVEGIAAQAFYKCKVLLQLALPDSVKYIGVGAFYGCENLMGFALGAGVEVIGESAFASCTVLSNFGVPESSSLREIGSYAFKDCKSLTSFSMPDTVVSIGTYAFYNSGLKASYSLIYAGDWLVGVKGQPSSVTVREGTVGISDYAFFNLTTLQSVVLPDSLKMIG